MTKVIQVLSLTEIVLPWPTIILFPKSSPPIFSQWMNILCGESSSWCVYWSSECKKRAIWHCISFHITQLENVRLKNKAAQTSHHNSICVFEESSLKLDLSALWSYFKVQSSLQIQRNMEKLCIFHIFFQRIKNGMK